MQWNAETRYKLLLEINNAIATQKTRDDLFKCLSKELRKHFHHDRLTIFQYDSNKQCLSYFAAADGVQAKGVLSLVSRPLADGAIAKMIISTGKPVFFDDLRKYTDLDSIGELVNAGLISIYAFPLIVRDQILGTLHFSYRSKPSGSSELQEALGAVSKQIAIAVDNMLAYISLKQANRHLREEKEYLLENSTDYRTDGFIFQSEAMANIMEIIEQVATTNENILLTGETGTGKDFLARLIHEKSHRNDRLFVKTNCPGLTSSLFESELFGHSQGAFTGAEKRRMGRFELADGGTIFLDEIGELPLSLQAKLLQVLQERRFERVGESLTIPVDVRVIAATNVSLMDSVRNGQFRQDLFYRLETVTIRVPSLRERRKDIPLLIDRINNFEAEAMRRPAPIYSNEVLDMLTSYDWPGNIRELKNLVKRLIILQPGRKINPLDVEKTLSISAASATEPADFRTMQQAERNHVIQALITAKGMVAGENGAARLLGMPRSTLVYRLKKYGIDPKDYRA